MKTTNNLSDHVGQHITKGLGMKRRGFLQIFGAIAAHAAVPMLAAETITSEIPWTTARLTAEMEAMFNARLGPAMAFFELTQNDGVKYAELAGAIGDTPEVIRVTYTTFAVGIEGGTREEAEAQLAKHFYDEFSKYAEGKPLMYWRRKPEFQSHDIVEYGDTFLTSEEIEDEVWKVTDVGDPIWRKTAHGQMVSTQRRRFDEHAELVIPPDVEMDFSTGNYKYVTKRTQLHKMSMRLAVPQYAGGDLAQFAHPEGAPVTRI